MNRVQDVGLGFFVPTPVADMFEPPPVRLMHYDARWRQEFQQTRSSILSSCDGFVTSVEHVGSTAVSGLISRPTIDMVAAVENQAALNAATPRIEGLNFREISLPDWMLPSDGQTIARLLIKPRHSVPEQPDPTHLVLLTLGESPLWGRLVGMRDWLRAHPETAIRFEEAKVAHWRSGEGDLDSYQSAKAIFFAHLEDQIDAASG